MSITNFTLRDVRTDLDFSPSRPIGWACLNIPVMGTSSDSINMAINYTIDYMYQKKYLNSKYYVFKQVFLLIIDNIEYNITVLFNFLCKTT